MNPNGNHPADREYRINCTTLNCRISWISSLLWSFLTHDNCEQRCEGLPACPRLLRTLRILFLFESVRREPQQQQRQTDRPQPLECSDVMDQHVGQRYRIFA